MKLQFKHQQYQLDAVNAVADCFNGEPFRSMQNYFSKREELSGQQTLSEAFANPELILQGDNLLTNIQQVQLGKNLPKSDRLQGSKDLPLNLDIEMETGTGKTYCYIRTLFELNRRYGWSKFIIVVPSIAIREGVKKSFEVMAEHFQQEYGKKARHFIYNSKRLHELDAFTADSNINVMIINIQAFNATGKDNRRIYEELDSFQSRKPIELIAETRPILILDEPQKMEGKKTLEALAKFNPLFCLRYSATHRTEYNKIHRLDAVDAFNQKLVKRIAVRGISVRGASGLDCYLYLQEIEISKQDPVAYLEFEQKQKSGIKRILRKVKKGDNLFELSNGLASYQGLILSEIDARTNKIAFLNGTEITAGEAVGDVTEETLRRIQIRETILAHLEKERSLFSKGIKTLSLFFIDEVAKYRDYSQKDEKGDYARIFEEEYQTAVAELLIEPYLNRDYAEYLQHIQAHKTHNGYFSIDKKSKRLTDPSVKTRGEDAGLSDDTDAYDLILKDKEKLLSFDEPTRFIFSHSALREGWDNPNVFTICLLKHSDNNVSLRQEVGRGLRLAVDKHGVRQDEAATVHDINVLTVVANESYADFVSALQNELAESKSNRTRIFDEAFFLGKVLKLENGENVTINEQMARKIHRHLFKNDFVDDDDRLTVKFHQAIEQGEFSLPSELAEYKDALLALISQNAEQNQRVENDRTPKNRLNANFYRKEFQALWKQIHHKAVYQVDFDSQDLIEKAIQALDRELKVEPLLVTVQKGEQNGFDQFKIKEGKTEGYQVRVKNQNRYDLVGQLAKSCNLTRKTIAKILSGIQPFVFAKFAQNPEQFIQESTRLIDEQLATSFIEKLSYHQLDETFDTSLFVAEQSIQDFGRMVKTDKHIYDYVQVDSANTERQFAENLDQDSDVVVYAKLPNGFRIPTPVGDYNPDWAVSFKEGSVKYIYFVAETKGAMSSLELRGKERVKRDCARVFFNKINQGKVKYDVVDSFKTLLDIVKG